VSVKARGRARAAASAAGVAATTAPASIAAGYEKSLTGSQSSLPPKLAKLVADAAAALQIEELGI